MLASELIRALEQAVRKHGDIEVAVASDAKDYGHNEVFHLSDDVVALETTWSAYHDAWRAPQSDDEPKILRIVIRGE